MTRRKNYQGLMNCGGWMMSQAECDEVAARMLVRAEGNETKAVKEEPPQDAAVTHSPEFVGGWRTTIERARPRRAAPGS
jgi:hypothetical protein